jgi:hypothetical protein
MSLVSRSFPGLFGGVSQQIPAMRHATQCAVQDNYLGTLVDGLYKRPGTRHIRMLDLSGSTSSVQGSYGAAHGHIIDKGPSGKYVLVLVNGNLMLYSLTDGTAQTVTFPDGLGYLNTSDPENDFRCVTVADYTFVINKSKVVTMQAATDSANPTNVAYINVRTAVPNVAYKVTINTTTVTYTTADSPNNASIASGIKTALDGALTGYTVSIIDGTNIVKVVKSSGTVTCKVSDGWGNNALQSLADGVQKFSDLPPAFETGYVVTITGTADNVRDAYYVKWDGAKWVECKKPTLPDTFNKTTMPHQLRPDGSGGWVFEEVDDWDSRKVGDDDTNPAPSFVGNTLRDIFFFRNRLGVLSADGLVLSRAGHYFGFWATTAAQVLDTDPIDLSATSAEVESLDWALVYNQTLLVFASSKQQFVLAGGDVLSPNTARLLPSTTFETYNGAKPEALGNKVMYVSTAGAYTAAGLYRVSQDTVTNSTEDITEHAPHYIPAGPRQLAVSTVSKMAVLIPGGVSKDLHVWKYEQNDQDQLTQKAWCRFIFENPDAVRIIKAHWDSKKLYLLLHLTAEADIIAGGRFALEVIDFDTTAQDQDAGFSLCLDRKAQLSFVSYDSGTSVSTMTLPYLADATKLTFLQCEPGLEPAELTPLDFTQNTGSITTTVTFTGDLTSFTVWAGVPYKARYEFTEVFMRDAQGVPVMEAELKLKHILVRYVDTGWFQSLVKSRLRDTYTYSFSGRTIGQPGQGVSELSLSTGSFRIPVQAKAADCQVSIESYSYLPCKIPYAEWVGDVTMKAQR